MANAPLWTPPPSRQFSWAGVEAWALSIEDKSSQATAQRLAQGVEGQRVDQLGIIPVVFNDWSGGFIRRFRIFDWRTALNQVYINPGIMTHIPFVSSIGWQVVSQSDVSGSVDHSGFRAANKRIHSVMFNGRWYAAIGTQWYKDTSTTDPAITKPATADGISDLVTALWPGTVGSSAVIMKGCDGVTDDIKYTTNPSADTVSWTEFVTLANAADYVSAGQYLDQFGHHVIICREDNTPATGNYMIAVSKDATLPVTTPSPVVDKATKDIPGSAATVTLSAVHPIGGGQNGGKGGAGADNLAQAGIWITADNVVSSDNAYAQYTVDGDGTPHSGVSAEFDVTFADPGVPLGARVKGIAIGIEHKESNAALNARMIGAQLLVRGSAGSPSRSGTGAELGTADATETIGSSTDSWGADLTGEDAQFLGLRLLYYFFETTAADMTIDVDDLTLTVTYQMPGEPLFYRSGGCSPGKVLSTPNRVVYLEPADADDETGVTQRRVLTFTDVEFEEERLFGTKSYPATGLDSIEDCFPFQGGVAIVGDKSSGLGKQMKHVDSQGEVRQFNFPGFHGSAAVGIVNGFDMGTAALLDVAHEDGSNTQWWIYHDGQFHGSYPQQDLSGTTISSLPLGWAEKTLHLFQNRVYRFFPVSTTALAAARSFVPGNPFSDPFKTNTSEKKHDGPITLITPEFEIGATENQNVLNVIQHLGRKISAVDSSYGTVQYQVEVSTDSADIDESFASPDVNPSAFNTRFQEYLVPGGEMFRTLMVAVTFDNDGAAQSGSLKSPDALPFELEIRGARPYLSTWVINIDWPKTRQQNETWSGFIDRLKTAAASSRNQPFILGDLEKASDLTDWTGRWMAEEVGRPLIEQYRNARGEPIPLTLTIQQLRGATA